MDGMDFAVTDAPSLDTSSVEETSVDTSSVETGADATDATDATSAQDDSGTEAAEGAPEEQQPPQPGQQFRAVENGKLNPLVKSALEKLKAENPQLAKAVQKALFAEDRLYRELPQGFKEIEQLRGTIEQLGGEQGIQDLQKETNGWREFDTLYTAGDPKVLEFLTETPEAQQAFLKIAPAAFEKFRQANPDGYAAYVSQVFVSDMQAQGIPLLLERLQDFLPTDNPKAAEIWKQIAGYVNRIGEFARKPVNVPAQAQPKQDDQRVADLTRREQEFTRREWRGEADLKHKSMFQQEWKALVGSRKLTPAQDATVKELYGLKMQAILKAKADFSSNLDRYFNSKQKDGFLRYFDSVYKEAVPKALRAAMGQVLPAKPGPKPGEAQTQPAQAKPAATAAAKKPSGGFQFVNAKPAMDQVDRVQTSTDMWLSGKAVLKNGSRVQFKTGR